MLKTIIIDDERLPIKQLERNLKDFEFIEIVDTFTKPLQALEAIKEKSPDLIFLDIEMPRVNGLELAQKIMDYNSKIEIVFVTAYNQYALEAFEVCAMGYLLKPIKKEQLEKVLNHIQNRHNPIQLECKSVEKNQEIIIQSLGKLDIIKNGTPMNIKWRTAKIKELFAYYVHNRKREIHRNELLEILWGDMEYERALVNLNTSNYQLKKQLENNVDKAITIQYQKDYYRLNLDNVTCDIDIFQDQISKDITPQNSKYFQNLLEKYKGTYFENVQGIWFQDEQYIIEKIYHEQSIKLLTYLFETQEYISCIKYCKQIITKDELNEQVWNILLHSLKSIGDQQVYQKELKNMKRIFNRFNEMSKKA